MIKNKTIVLGFLTVLGAYLLLQQAVLMQYLTLAQVAVIASAVAFAVLDARIRNCPLGRIHAPREEKDLRLFLFGKNVALLCGVILAVFCALSLLPGSPFYWNLQEKIAVAGLPMPLTRPQIRVLEQVIAKYEKCTSAEDHRALMQTLQQESAQSVALYTSVFGYTKNRALRLDLLKLLEGTTGLTLRPAGELDDPATAAIVERLLRWQDEHPQPTASAAVTPAAPVAPVAAPVSSEPSASTRAGDAR